MKHKAYGFTIVELLIVIVIIAILAAITMVAYNGIQNKANDSAVQADLASTYKKLQLYNGEFSAFPVANSDAILKPILVASKSSYETNANSYIYCRTGEDAAIIGKSKSGTGFYVGSRGSGKIASSSWANANATACPLAGISTSATGYQFRWFYSNGAWSW